MKIRIDLTDDQVDEVVLFEMKSHSELLKLNILALKKIKKRRKFEQDDLDRYTEVLSAMKVILGYYGSHLKK